MDNNEFIHYSSMLLSTTIVSQHKMKI